MNRQEKRRQFRYNNTQESKKFNYGAFGKSKINRKCTHNRSIYRNRCVICNGIVNDTRI